MFFTNKSELPIKGLRGGDEVPGAARHVLSNTTVNFNDRGFTFSMLAPDEPPTYYSSTMELGFVDFDNFQESDGSLRVAFNGYNYIKDTSSNPVVDFGDASFGWTVPLDMYVNAAARVAETATTSVNATDCIRNYWYEIVTPGDTDFTLFGAANSTSGTIFQATKYGIGTGTTKLSPATAGGFETALWYEIKTVGTTDFTLIGASANTIGVMFRATGPGSGTGEAYSTTGGRVANVIVTEEFLGTLHMYPASYRYGDIESNRLGHLTSTDGRTWTQQAEVLFSGTDFGRSLGPTAISGGNIWSLCSNGVAGRGFDKVLRSSVDGVTWVEHGAAIGLSDDPASPRYYSIVAGQHMFVVGAYMYAPIPCSNIAADWPEMIGLWRHVASDLGVVSNWEFWGFVAIRDAVNGGLWQLDPFKVNGDYWALVEQRGMVGWENINTDIMNTMRETPYYRNNVDGFSSLYAMRGDSISALTDWDWFPLVDGSTYQFRLRGKFLAVVDDAPVSGGVVEMTYDGASARTHWVVQKQADLWMLKPVSAQTLALKPDSTNSQHNRGMPMEVVTFDAGDDTLNKSFHWLPGLGGDYHPKNMVLMNRYTSLALKANATQDTNVGQGDDFWQSIIV